MPVCECLLKKSRRLCVVRSDDARNDGGRRQCTLQRVKTLARRVIRKHFIVLQQAIEKEHREWQLSPHCIDFELAPEPAHGELERMRCAVFSQSDRFTIEYERMARRSAHGIDD